MRSNWTTLFLSFPLLLSAQQGLNKTTERATRSHFITSAPHPTGVENRSNEDALWSEDFENGLNGWTVETPDGNVEWTLTSTGNTGGFTPGPLESTTGSPGGHWIMADSDAHGTDGHLENTSITSPPITGYDTVPYMLLRFEQSFRQLNDDRTLVEVSGNGGADWTTYEVNHNIVGNQSTPGAPAAQVITLNITSALAQGSGEILIRFRWISTQGFTYSWQVDDVALLPVHHNDLVLQEATWASWNLDEPGFIGMPCTIYPLGETHELKFKGLIGNNGGQTQTNVHLRVEVEGPGGYNMILNSGSVTLAPGGMDSLFILDYEPPDVEGDYHFHVSAEQTEHEDVPGDNGVEEGIRVDAHVFARDEGRVVSQRDNNGQDYEIGNRFWIDEYGRTLQGVEVAVGPGTEVGAVISAMVYDGNFNYVGQSDIHVITADEINAPGGNHFISLPMMDPTELQHDRLYLVCVYAQVSDGAVFTGLSGNSLPQTSMLFRHDTDHWYYVTSTPMVRMVLDDFTGIGTTQVLVSGLQAYPSPFEEKATVSYRTERSGAARWELLDATGRSVRAEDLGELSPAEHQLVIDGQGLEDGTYLFTLYSGGERSTMRLVHQARR